MEKQSTGRVMMKLVVSVLALFLLMACGVLMSACKEKQTAEHTHSYDKSTSENVAATCGATGYDIYVCSCGDRYAVPTYATGKHNFSSGYCTVCGLPDVYDDAQLSELLQQINSEVQTIKQSVNEIHKHQFTGETVTVNATCYASGFIAKKCECGSTGIVSSIDKLAHEWLNEAIVIAPTCTSAGESYKKCAKCEATVLYETLAPTGHTFGNEMETIVAATCTTEGWKAYKCSACGETGYSESIPAKGHKMVWDTKATRDDFAANCQHGEMSWYHCAEGDNCPEKDRWGEPKVGNELGDHYYPEDPAKKVFDDEKAVPATCTEPGTKVEICVACHEAGVETPATRTVAGDPAKGHDWERVDENNKPLIDLSTKKEGDNQVSDYTAPLCNKAGGFTWKCADCDATTLYVIPIDPNAHKLVMDGSSPKESTDYTQLNMSLVAKDNNWNTVTYTHLLCEYCGQWLIKTADIPEGYDPADPEKVPATGTDNNTTEGEGDAEQEPKPEYTVIKRVEFDYSKQQNTENLRTKLKAWEGIIDFSWHSWQLYDEHTSDLPNGGTITDDFGNEVKIQDVSCTQPGLHWYWCNESNGNEHLEHVYTPAIGHNFDVPNSVDEWRELYWADQTQDTSSMSQRKDDFIGADCTDYGVLFLSCTNCFATEDGVKVYKGSIKDHQNEEPSEPFVWYEGCKTAGGQGTNHNRIAITVRDGKLVTIKLDDKIIDDKDSYNDLNDERLADKIRNLDEWVLGYNQPQTDDRNKIKVENYVTDIFDCTINGDSLERILNGFLGDLPVRDPDDPGVNAEGKPNTYPYPGTGHTNEGTNYTMFKEDADSTATTRKYDVFDPLGHDWKYTDFTKGSDGKDVAVVDENAETTDGSPWLVKRDPKNPQEGETFDCTQPGYTGRYCLRACCDSKENEAEGKDCHEYDLHQRIELKKDTTVPENNDDKKEIIDLNREDAEGLHYYLVVEETPMSKDGGKEIKRAPKIALTYVEKNQLFEVLKEKTHNLEAHPMDNNATCGQRVKVTFTCRNTPCNVKHQDDTIDLKHVGDFDHYYTIGACGTAFAKDHSIIEYDYCKACGKRVGLELEYEYELDAEGNKQIKTDKDGNKIQKETKNVIWTEGDIDPMTGKPVEILPCALSEIKENYRHFPFNREAIEGLLTAQHTETVDGKEVVVDAPNYRLYSALWSEIDKWYEGDLDSSLYGSPLTGYLVVETLKDKVNGWTARCYDCYDEFYTHKCDQEASGAATTDEETETTDTFQSVWFFVEDGKIEEIWEKRQIRKLVAIEMLKEQCEKSHNHKIDGIDTLNDEEAGEGEEKNCTIDHSQPGEDGNYGFTHEEIVAVRKYLRKGKEGYGIGKIRLLIQEYLKNHANCDVYRMEVTKCGKCGAYCWEVKDKMNPFTPWNEDTDEMYPEEKSEGESETNGSSSSSSSVSSTSSNGVGAGA